MFSGIFFFLYIIFLVNCSMVEDFIGRFRSEDFMQFYSTPIISREGSREGLERVKIKSCF